ncbi:MAG TPA: M13 family metallopeptidase [Candidatus Angelobacter sp.]
MKTQNRLPQALFKACILFLGCTILVPAVMFGQAGNASVSKRPQSFDLTAMDRTVDPCEDFYEYACGTWRKENPVPSDQVFWARYNQLAEYNREVLRKLLEQAAVVTPRRTPAARTIGDFYSSCMNTTVAEQQGHAPLKPELAGINSVSSREQLMKAVAHLHSIGVAALFEFGVQPDMHDATMETATIFQGGLGLPDRDYYIGQDDKSKETRARYAAHIAAMLTLAGESPETAPKDAATVLQIEIKLAEGSYERVKMRDPQNRDHKMTVHALAEMAPNLLFPLFFKAAGAPAFAEVNVAPPDFFLKLNAVIDSAPLDNWKAYLRWRVIQANAPFLSNAFVKEDFEFERRFLNGQREQEPRWKTCVSATDRLLGQALGRVYVEQTFSPASKERLAAMVNLEEQALAQDIQELPWMTAETRQQALLKLKAITNKIGYPEKWLDYSTVNMKRDDLPGNVVRARKFQVSYNLEKIAKPVDPKEWVITTPTVNAYYYPPENSINFPAGVLQPPLFNPEMDDAVNFGAIGWLIGHELTHGFDDQGSKFDGHGNLANWWTQSDRAEFEKRTSCLADQYQQLVVVDDVHLNGRLTLGENTADNGGIRIALTALHQSLATHPQAQNTIDGFTADQRFFISFAQQWCANITPERLRVIAKVDPHAPVSLRTLGTLRNYSDFAKAFGCKSGQAMVSPNVCRVW